jgi:DNA polymerase-3 subunit chi
MAEIRFYHLQKQSLEQALPRILSKALDQGHKIIIKTKKDTIEAVSELLWNTELDPFLAHGSVFEKNEELQPIYITDEEKNPNQADILILINGEAYNNMDKFKLCCEIFDGNNQDALSQARLKWKEYKDAKLNTTYWQEDAQGKWKKIK